MKKFTNYLGIFFSLTISFYSFADVTIKSDVVYGHKDGLALIYDVIKPDNANDAAIVFMMSGGWFSRWTPAELVSQRFEDTLDAGFTVIPVYHGSAPRYHVPDAYSDVSRAIRHIKLRAQQHGIDPDRIGVTGGSAGGHLSLMVGLDADAGDPNSDDEVMRQDNSVAAVVAYFPPVDLRQLAGPGSWSERFPALNFDPEKAESISPILHADPDDPPTLLIHGDADGLVGIENSVMMQEEFQSKNVESQFITIPGGGHGFQGDDAQLADSARLEWFKKHLL